MPWQRIKVDMGDTSKTIDQATTSGSRTIERAGPQVRQAAAAARKELLRHRRRKSSARLPKSSPCETAVVSVAGNPSKRISYAQLIGGKRFNVSIQAEGRGNDLKLAQDVKAKDPKAISPPSANPCRVLICRPKLTGEMVYIHDMRIPGMLHGRVIRPPMISTAPVSIDESSAKQYSRFRQSRARRKLRRRRCKNRMGGDASRRKTPSHLVATEI